MPKDLRSLVLDMGAENMTSKLSQAEELLEWLVSTNGNGCASSSRSTSARPSPPWRTSFRPSLCSSVCMRLAFWEDIVLMVCRVTFTSLIPRVKPDTNMTLLPVAGLEASPAHLHEWCALSVRGDAHVLLDSSLLVVIVAHGDAGR